MIPFNKKPNGVFKHTAVLMIILCISQSCFSLLEDHDRQLFKERQSLAGDRFERQALKTSPYIRDVGADSRQSRIDASDIRTDFREIRTELNSETARYLRRAANIKDSRGYSQVRDSRNSQRRTLLNNENIRDLRRVSDIKNSREHSQVRDFRNAQQTTYLNRENTRALNRASDILDSREYRQLRDAPSAQLRNQLNKENTRNLGLVAAIQDFKESDQVRELQTAQSRVSESRCSRSIENPAQMQRRTVDNSRQIRSRRIKRNNELLVSVRRAFIQPSFKSDTENQGYPKQKLYRPERRGIENIRNTDDRINRVFRNDRSSDRRTIRNMVERLGGTRDVSERHVQENRKRSSGNVRYLEMAATFGNQGNILQQNQQIIFGQRASIYGKERTTEKVRALTNTQRTIDHENTVELNSQFNRVERRNVRQPETNRQRARSLNILPDSTTRRWNRRSTEAERNSQREIQNVDSRQQSGIRNRERIFKTVRNLDTRRSVRQYGKQRGTQMNEAQRISLRQRLNNFSRRSTNVREGDVSRMMHPNRSPTNMHNARASDAFSQTRLSQQNGIGQNRRFKDTQKTAVREIYSEISDKGITEKYRHIPENSIYLRVLGTARKNHYDNERAGDEIRTQSRNVGRISTNDSTRNNFYKPTRNASPVSQFRTRSQTYPITPSSSDFHINRQSLQERKGNHPQTIIPSNQDNSSHTREIILFQDFRGNMFNKVQESQNVRNLAAFRVRGMPVLNGKSNNTWINVVETVLVLVLIGQAIGGSSKGKYSFLSWQGLILKQKAQ